MVDVVGRAKVVVESVADEPSARQAGKRTGDSLADGVGSSGEMGGQKFGDSLSGSLGKIGPKLAGGVGAALGAALVEGIVETVQREAEGNRLAASLGLDAEEAARLNETASKVYAQGWGESFAEVQAGVAAVKSSFQDLEGSDLTRAATAAQTFADIFGVDIAEAAGTASVAVKQGLAKDAVEAFDLMTAAAQKVPVQFRDELQDAVTEYSSFFASLGIDGPEAFGLLAEAAELGQYGIDKVGDSIKEFQIRAIDSSKTTADAFKLLNLDIDEMQTAIAGGGEQAEAAFRKIVLAIADIKDPAEQSQAAIALFGTPLEDLSQEKLPEFIDTLAKGTGGMEDFEGATDKAGETASKGLGPKLKTLGREIREGFMTELKPLNKEMSRLVENLGKGNPNGPLVKTLRAIKDIVGDITLGPLEDLIGLLADLTEFDGDQTIEKFQNMLGAFNLGLGGLGGSAGGGRIGSGLRLVGENGPELIETGSQGAYVHNNSETRRLLSGAGGDTINNYWQFYGPESMSQARRDEDWYRRYGTRFGSAGTAVAR